MKSNSLCWLLTFAFTFAPDAGHTAEHWGDAKLTVGDGLELWLDAARASGDQTHPADNRLSAWHDASGKRRHLRQEEAGLRPQVLKLGDLAIVRFDGLDDHLRAVQQGGELGSFTIFLVAAPRQNGGAFRALLALNKAGEKDYTSGLTIDLGPAPSSRFSTLNIEGRGFGGARSLRQKESPFGKLHAIEIASDVAAGSIKLWVDGAAEGERPRDGLPLALDEITLGARYYNNGSGPQHVDGYGRADIAEVLVYSRVLAADETKAVRDYLAAKYAPIKDALPADRDGGSEPLVPVASPPPVQVFLPGFSVRELPIELTNINNVKCRADGTLVALGYDGRVWLLSDSNGGTASAAEAVARERVSQPSDGDGVEDKSRLFWENKSGLRAPIGMDLTPPGYKHGDGLFVVGKTRCVLIVDTDRDEQADREIEVAGGWKESFHNVDGLGVAYDPRDGSVFYGRGTYNFADPLLRDKEGRAHYSLADESSAIIRVSPDFQSREIVATGVRFPVALRLNRQGDLFCTDQEGATWVPNGNPFDELLHIQKGRHYGFPPRHPQHLPDVIDEPSTFDYGPQHQSTCGFNFNEPVNEGGPIFGPAAWSGDALVTGESRGKLYRTKLVKTPVGYVARTNLLAALGMLTVDACIAADGGLVVCCHSGGPDWGSGPSGKGKLFKITYTDRSHSQPVLVWATGPRELRVEFDRPVEPDHLKAVLERSKLTEGQHVRAGDRFETLWPGYAAVQMQRLAARRDVALRSAQLTPDRRTLLLAIDPIRTAAHYALTLPGMGRPNADEQAVDQPTPSDAVPLLPPRKQWQVLQPEGFLPQHPAIDLDFDLTGCEAVWNPEGGPQWSGWLPHLDLQVAQAMTAGSAPHDALWRSLDQPGELTLRTQLDLTDMLRPAVQPGSTLDYELPPETVTVTLSSRWEVTLSAPSPSATKAGSVSFTVSPKRNETVPLEVHIKKEGSTPQLTLHWTTAEDNRPRPLPLRRLFLPWADASEKGKAVEPAPSPPPEIAGGSWARGRKEFFGVQAACAKCHTISGQGGAIGPDLSNLIHRDYASVLRDIVTPSFALNPDHLSYIVSLEDGRTLTGVVNSSHGKLQVGDLQGVVTEIDPADVEEMRASSISTMPEGLTKPLSPERLRDLMAFLLMPPPQMPRDFAGPRPKPRTIAEVNAVLAGSEQPSALSRPIRVVLVAGPKDHGPGEHDYPAWQKAWAELLSAGDNVEVATAWEWPAKEEFEKADVIVVYQHGDWDARRAIDVDRYLARGGGLVYIHWAIDGRKLGGEMTQRTALAALGAVGFRHGPLTLEFNRKVKHPVTRNFDKLELTDETYWKMAGTLPGDRLLATAVEDGQPQPQLWSVEHGPGRVFVSIPGHYSWTFDDPLFRVLLLRAIAWSAHEPVDRFNDLVWPGADLAK